jgi:hypothetical protein
MSPELEGDEEEDEEVELEEDSVSEGDPRDQTRPPVLVRLLLALAGTGVLKHGFVSSLGVSGSGSDASFLGFSVKIPGG